MIQHDGFDYDVSITRLVIDLNTRYYRLRKLKLVGVVLNEGSSYWLVDNLGDPWGSKRRISIEEFDKMLSDAEQTQRKDVGSELYNNCTWKVSA